MKAAVDPRLSVAGSSPSSQISADVSEQDLRGPRIHQGGRLNPSEGPTLGHTHVHKPLIHNHFSGDGDYSSTLLIITKSVEASGSLCGCVSAATHKAQLGAIKKTLTASALFSLTKSFKT